MGKRDGGGREPVWVSSLSRLWPGTLGPSGGLWNAPQWSPISGARKTAGQPAAPARPQPWAAPGPDALALGPAARGPGLSLRARSRPGTSSLGSTRVCRCARQ